MTLSSSGLMQRTQRPRNPYPAAARRSIQSMHLGARTYPATITWAARIGRGRAAAPHMAAVRGGLGGQRKGITAALMVPHPAGRRQLAHTRR